MSSTAMRSRYKFKKKNYTGQLVVLGPSTNWILQMEFRLSGLVGNNLDFFLVFLFTSILWVLKPLTQFLLTHSSTITVV